MTEPVWVRLSSLVAVIARAMPKSATFTSPASVMSTLPGFTSRWTTPLRWAKPGGGHVGGDAGGPLRIDGAVGTDDVRDGAAVDVLHDDVVGAPLLAPVVDAHDVGVVQVGRGLGLTAEAGHERRVGGELREQDLDGHQAIEQAVAREVDLGHAAAAHPAVQFVASVEDDLFAFSHRSAQPTRWRRSPGHLLGASSPRTRRGGGLRVDRRRGGHRRSACSMT
jgi:hypothetical protein